MNDALQAAIAQANKACALAEQGYLDEAIDQLRQILNAHPEMVGARLNLAGLLNRKGLSDEAIENYHACLKAQPDFAECWNNLGTALLHTTRTSAAFEAYSKAVELKPDYLEAHSNRFLTTLYRCKQEQPMLRAREDWLTALQASPLLPQSALPERGSRQKLRIGFLSPDLRLHSVAFFLWPVLEAWKQYPVELCLYADVARPDTISARFQSLADHYENVASKKDAELLEHLRAQKLDVLFDLCGHFDGNRQAIFAARAAPCQISWLGYPVATHTPNIDYRISDPRIQATSQQSKEALLILESGLHCYRPLIDTPAIQTPPSTADKTFTFGCFNNARKISPESARLWGIILQQCPNARLILKSKAYSSKGVREQLSKWIHADPAIQQRIHFMPRTASLQEHFQAYNQMDLALDTYPYSGTTTTCECLWMGVPTITLQGAEEQSRVSAALLHQAKLQQFITDTPQAYLALACALAHQPEVLKRYRSKLRNHIHQSDLMRPQRLVKELDHKLRELIGRQA